MKTIFNPEDQVKLSHQDMEASIYRWKNSLVARIISTKRWSLVTMREGIKRAINMQQDLEVFHHKEGVFILKFRFNSDLERIMRTGPWSVFGYVLVCRRWNPRINPSTLKFDTEYFWVELENLDYFELQKSIVVNKIGNTIGKVVKAVVPMVIDTQKARVKVEIRIDKPFKKFVWVPLLSGDLVQIHFHYCHTPSYFCRNYYMLGHLSGFCPERIQHEEDPEPERPVVPEFPNEAHLINQ